jgi:hypothetical protein
LTDLALVLPSEPGSVSGDDTTQLGDIVTKENTVVYFVERVNVELAKDVAPDGKGFLGTRRSWYC